MSVLAVTDSTVVTRPVSAYGSVGGWSRRGAAGRLHTVPPGRPPTAAVASVAADSEPITVTVSVGLGDPGRRDRVLAALRQLITAAGSDIAVAGPVPAGDAPAPELVPSDLSAANAERNDLSFAEVQRSDLSTAGMERGDLSAAGMERGELSRAGAERRAFSGGPAERSDVSRAGVLPGIRLEPGPRTLAVDGRRIELSRMEYDLLLFLARHPSQVFSRNQLLTHVWGHTHTGARTVDVHVSRLRTKLGADTDVIATVYGLGYRLADHAGVAVVDR